MRSTSMSWRWASISWMRRPVIALLAVDVDAGMSCSHLIGIWGNLEGIKPRRPIWNAKRPGDHRPPRPSLPGWLNSRPRALAQSRWQTGARRPAGAADSGLAGFGPGHWQTLAARLAARGTQDDWTSARGDWMARLDEVLLAQPGPVVLAAHSLGCLLVAAWAAHSSHPSARVAGAAGRPARHRARDMPPHSSQLAPPSAHRLPFQPLPGLQQRRPLLRAERAALAAAWGAKAINRCWPRGHQRSLWSG